MQHAKDNISTEKVRVLLLSSVYVPYTVSSSEIILRFDTTRLNRLPSLACSLTRLDYFLKFLIRSPGGIYRNKSTEEKRWAPSLNHEQERTRQGVFFSCMYSTKFLHPSVPPSLPPPPPHPTSILRFLFLVLPSFLSPHPFVCSVENRKQRRTP